MSVAGSFPLHEPLPTPDWTAIRLLYEANDLSIREISRRHCISDTAIHKRAKAENWSLWTPESPAAKPPLALAQTEVQTHNEDFRWEWEPENEEIVVPEQLALAIYRNPWGQVIIRQQGFMEEDVYVRLNAESLPKVIAKLQRLLRDIEAEDAAAGRLPRFLDEGCPSCRSLR